MLSNPRELAYSNSIVCTGIDSDEDYVYTVWTVSSTHEYRKYDIKTLQQIASGVVMSTPSGISLITPASAVVVSSSTNQTDIVELSSGHRQQITTNALVTFSSQIGQQVAGNIYLQEALYTTSTTSTVNHINSSGSITQLTPIELSGDRATCVIVKQVTASLPNLWLIGTNDGKVYEVNSSGTVSKTITLPTTPNVGSAPTHIVSGLSHYPPNLAVTTNQGMLYIYEYESGNLIYQQMVGDANSGTASGPLLCASASGSTLLTSSRSGASLLSSISEMYFATTPPTFEQYFIDANVITEECHLNAYNRKAYLRSQSGSIYSFQDWNTGGLSKAIEPAEMHIPVGVQVDGKIIRIRDDGPGNSTVEIVAEITAGANALPATEDRDYIELALNTAETDWDIREFKA